MLDKAILVVGSLNMDLVVHVPRIPIAGETLLGTGSLKFVPGGKGANQAVAMARLGASVSMAGRVGNDPFGDRLRSSLEADGIETQLVAVDQTATSGVASVFLTSNGENAIVVASGANMSVGLDQAQMDRIFARIPQTRALVLQLEIPIETVDKLVSAAWMAGVPVILNLAPAQPIANEILSRLEVLIVNETEASLLSGITITGIEDADNAAISLSERGIRMVVITLGAQGAVLVYADEKGQRHKVHQPAPKVQVVDTTAAGDCFVGAFTVARIEGQSPRDALRFAVYASALKVTKFGAQSGLPTRKEVENFLRYA